MFNAMTANDILGGYVGSDEVVAIYLGTELIWVMPV